MRNSITKIVKFLGNMVRKRVSLRPIHYCRLLVLEEGSEGKRGNEEAELEEKSRKGEGPRAESNHHWPMLRRIFGYQCEIIIFYCARIGRCAI